MNTGPHQRRGFSLAEVAMASAVLAIGASAVLGVVGQVGARRQETVSRATGMLLASELLARIVSLPLADPQTGVVSAGTDAGESSIAQFDDVTDFAGSIEPVILDAGGAAVAGMNGYSRSVTIEWLTDATGTAVSVSPTTAARIVVVVQWRSKPVATLTTIRTVGWDGGKP